MAEDNGVRKSLKLHLGGGVGGGGGGVGTFNTVSGSK